MKTSIKTFVLLLSLFTSQFLSAQVVYSVQENFVWKSNGVQSFPNPCYNCTFNITDGVTLTIERDVTFQNVTFKGGSVIVKSKQVQLWTANNLKSTFNNTNFLFDGTASLIGSAPIVMNESVFTFNGNSYMIAQHALDVASSKLRFTGNSYFEATGNPVNLRNNSSMVAGDGSLTSKAFIKFNGPMLNVYDNSGITIANKNNYYFNWSAYTNKVTNQTLSTSNNNLNCGANGTNGCSAPVMYGPSMLGTTGFGPITLLPIRLGAFTAKLQSDGTAELTWVSLEERSTDRFEIERSINGNDWQKTTSVKAAGNSSASLTYRYQDPTSFNGTIYYRLKMVDIDGLFTYSVVKSVSKIQESSVAVYPNPTTDLINISAKTGTNQKVSVQLINNRGQLLQQMVVRGDLKASFDVSSNAPGLYFVRIMRDGEKTESFKVQIVR